MGRMRSALLTAAATAACAIVWAETLGKGLSLREMDWNGDGLTSPGEVLDAFDMDVEPVTVEGRACRRIYFLKDGMTVRELCP